MWEIFVGKADIFYQNIREIIHENDTTFLTEKSVGN